MSTVINLPGKNKPSLDNFAKRVADWAIPRAQKKGITTGQLAAAFLNLAAELAVMGHTGSDVFESTACAAYDAAEERSKTSDRPRQIVVEMKGADGELLPAGTEAKEVDPNVN